MKKRENYLDRFEELEYTNTMHSKRMNQIRRRNRYESAGDVVTDDEEMTAFLFSLACYSGEPITVVSHRKGGCVVSVKDGRYSLDNDLAQAISI